MYFGWGQSQMNGVSFNSETLGSARDNCEALYARFETEEELIGDCT